MRCYACRKEEEVRRKGRDLVSDIEMVEAESAVGSFTDVEEAYMPLCRKCLRKVQSRRAQGNREEMAGEKRRRTSLQSARRLIPKCGRRAIIHQRKASRRRRAQGRRGEERKGKERGGRKGGRERIGRERTEYESRSKLRRGRVHVVRRDRPCAPVRKKI
jgi:hypothetical protein